MMYFESPVIYTGRSEKVSKKGNNYTVVNMLSADGEAFSCMLKEGQTMPDLNQLDRCNALFELRTGRFMQIALMRIEKNFENVN